MRTSPPSRKRLAAFARHLRRSGPVVVVVNESATIDFKDVFLTAVEVPALISLIFWVRWSTEGQSGRLRPGNALPVAITDVGAFPSEARPLQGTGRHGRREQLRMSLRRLRDRGSASDFALAGRRLSTPAERALGTDTTILWYAEASSPRFCGVFPKLLMIPGRVQRPVYSTDTSGLARE